ncbi:hypothetical protein L1049_000463 [Liquidambar formosana]|uniref:AAA+ ATPase domain-containing protein n=1 Tax=Liquidambar formosana TaxID=63359 RepID=A0AAP0NAM0_LIQFO
MSEIVPIFLKNKFLNDFQRAERELTQKLPHHHSQFQKIKNVLENNIIVPSMPTDAKALLHDLNDTLADCVTFVEQRKSHKTKPFSLADNSFRRKIQKQLHQINAKLQEIEDGGNANAAQGESSSSRSSLEIDTSLRSVLYAEYKIHGFDQQLKKIVELLRHGRKAIGIVGIGGSGKTALAQMVFKTVLFRGKFEFGFWVNLSHHVARPEDTYDDIENRVLIKCAIYGEPEPEPESPEPEPEPKPRLFRFDADGWSIEKMLKLSKARKCLIVLDGVKHVSHWYHRSGSEGLHSGSAVIVTSRLQEVAEGMVGYRNLHHMQPISEPEKIWLIFQDKVKKNGLMDASHPSLLRMKEEIVEQCYGLPLAAKTLADIIPKRIYEVDYELSERPDIIPRFLRNKFINDFQEAERGLRQKLPSHSQFQEIKNVVEHNIITTSMLNEAKTLLYTLNETLTDCVTFCEQRKAHKRKPFSWEESSFLRKIQKQLNQIKLKLLDIKESDADTTPSSLLPLSSLSGMKDNEEIWLVWSPRTYGLDQQVKKILELLRERKAIGIVGIAGSGKTTLAKMVVREVLREEKFEVVYWVILRHHVEQPEDPHDDNKTTVLLELVRRSDGALWDMERYDCSIKEMWDKVSNAASKTTKCLIVLDGAKNISDWYKEGSPHLFNESAFIVTSTLQEVAEGMVGAVAREVEMSLLSPLSTAGVSAAAGVHPYPGSDLGSGWVAAPTRFMVNTETHCLSLLLLLLLLL